ncbi:MAG: hypothetical protein Kow00120_27320 [Anaerolineae bacterium]
MRGRLILALLALAAASALGVATAQEGEAVITSPAPGETVFGEVQIVGTASHPEFRRYQLEVATADQPDDWVPIQEPVSQQVTEGVLGVWDTTAGLPDGVYRLRLRVVLRDGATFDAVVDDVQLNNTQPTAVPTALPQPTAARTTPTPTPGPSPTPLIQQPPSVTPRAAAGASAPPGRTDQGDAWITSAEIQAACLNGLYVALVAFALLALWLAVRPVVRPWLRRVWDNIRRGIQ